jgi:sugar phosphate isomerase/epimerase
MAPSRRQFIHAAAASTAWLSTKLRANPLGLPIGLQLWTVREELQKNFDATLRKIAQIGYREVELFELPVPTKQYLRKKFSDAGLTPVSGHFYLDEFKNQATIDAAKELGLKYMIVVFPTLRSLGSREVSRMKFEDLVPLYEKITLDDYKWNADQFNRLGETLQKSGLQLGYHNHAVDLKRFGNMVALDTLIESTDPRYVTFEMDCGHVIHAGRDPIAYLKKYPTRIELLHLKDLKPGFEPSTSLDTELKGTNTEIGAGRIDWKQLFTAAKQTGHVRHYFVEHEGKMDHPPFEAVKLSYEYLHARQ